MEFSRLSRYRDDKSPGDESDWADCLRALLLHTRPIGDVEAIARTPKIGEKLFIDVQKKISGRAVRSPGFTTRLDLQYYPRGPKRGASPGPQRTLATLPRHEETS